MTWLIARASLLAIILGVSLSGYGMSQAHSTMMMDEPGMDHSMHAQMDHSGHDTAPTTKGNAQDTSHQGHANCPMIACCHTGAVSMAVIPALVGAVTCQHPAFVSLQLDKATPESAKNPPKYA